MRNYFKNISISFLVLLVLFIAALFIFTFIAHEVLWNKEERIDTAVFQYIHTHYTNEGNTAFMKFITYFASAPFLQIGFWSLVIFYLIKKMRRRAFQVFAIGFGGLLINYFMKLFFRRTRPADPLIDPLTNFSFPSGHATLGFVFYGLLIYLVWKTDLQKAYKYVLGIILLSIALVIGFSRIYLRLHFTSDVLAGFCIGFAWLVLTVWLIHRQEKRRNS